MSFLLAGLSAIPASRSINVAVTKNAAPFTDLRSARERSAVSQTQKCRLRAGAFCSANAMRIAHGTDGGLAIGCADGAAR
jgi:hypothetical protein